MTRQQQKEALFLFAYGNPEPLNAELQAAGLDELTAVDTVLNKQGTDAFLCLEGDEDAGVQRMARCGYVSAYGTEAQEEPHLRAGFHITDRP